MIIADASRCVRRGTSIRQDVLVMAAATKPTTSLSIFMVSSLLLFGRREGETWFSRLPEGLSSGLDSSEHGR